MSSHAWTVEDVMVWINADARMDLMGIIVKLKLAINFKPQWLDNAGNHVDTEFVCQTTDVNAIKDGLADFVTNMVIQYLTWTRSHLEQLIEKMMNIFRNSTKPPWATPSNTWTKCQNTQVNNKQSPNEWFNKIVLRAICFFFIANAIIIFIST